MKNQERLLRIEQLVREIFDAADKEGLFLGLGYEPRLPMDKQEGPKIKELKKLIRGEGSEKKVSKVVQ